MLMQQMPTMSIVDGHLAGRSTRRGVVTLDAVQTELLAGLDAAFCQFAVELGAVAVTPPPLLESADLQQLDYFRNFPHLALVANTYGEEAAKQLADGAAPDDLPIAVQASTGQVLPSATCYGVFLGLRG